MADATAGADAMGMIHIDIKERTSSHLRLVLVNEHMQKTPYDDLIIYIVRIPFILLYMKQSAISRTDVFVGVIAIKRLNKSK